MGIMIAVIIIVGFIAGLAFSKAMERGDLKPVMAVSLVGTQQQLNATFAAGGVVYRGNPNYFTTDPGEETLLIHAEDEVDGRINTGMETSSSTSRLASSRGWKRRHSRAPRTPSGRWNPATRQAPAA